LAYSIAGRDDSIATLSLDFNYGFGLLAIDPGRALEILERAANAPGIDGHATEAWCVYHYAAAQAQLGHTPQALRMLRRFLALPAHGHLTAIVGGIDVAAQQLAIAGRFEAAAALAGASARWRESIGLAGQHFEVTARALTSELLSAALAREDFERLKRQGRALTLEQTVRTARSALDELIESGVSP
jgi:hypothetical protein